MTIGDVAGCYWVYDPATRTNALVCPGRQQYPTIEKLTAKIWADEFLAVETEQERLWRLVVEASGG